MLEFCPTPQQDLIQVCGSATIHRYMSCLILCNIPKRKTEARKLEQARWNPYKYKKLGRNTGTPLTKLYQS